MSRRSNTVSLVLFTGYVLVQLENVVSTLVAIFPAKFQESSSSSEGNTISCGSSLSPSKTWLAVSGNFVLAAYDLILVIMALHYFRKDLQEVHSRSITCFMNVVFRDHIIYFILTFLSMIFSAFSLALQPIMVAQTNAGNTLMVCATVGGMLFILQTCMAGPLMMLSIRRHEAHAFSVFAPEGTELTVRFAHPSNIESARDMRLSILEKDRDSYES
ncbi:hypothetical protein CONPUDRAFT_91889 [Coniophora puteana RWD-64-598 SS2]|uniref:Uncharacterized protein n=1 Tax=Coniophora puteana (strain RWD-64-598) TaxID=741705 RepID=A0A5M3MHE3_CONPW|nr:uncharacterized protein CONPUDRAFT_91889 [Coniophora puteana RWD-64-598 SS2]EIW78477.1 hypothetical protein CONPUDRAFT_91889 [Coniophora puteana RWD-64-598 SS2]